MTDVSPQKNNYALIINLNHFKSNISTVGNISKNFGGLNN